MSLFRSVKKVKEDPVFGLAAMFQKDQRIDKVNLIVGVYKDQYLRTPVLEVVRKAEEKIFHKNLPKEYLPIEGDSLYLEAVASLIFGSAFFEENRKRISRFQSIGGTGALRLAADFLRQEAGDRIHISDPSWVNHQAIFNQAGLFVEKYPYYDFNEHSLDFIRLKTYLEGVALGSIVLFQTCCHNPSGADPSKEQWKQIAEICKDRKIIPLFDSAYLGFGKNFDEDVYPIRLFAELEIELLVAISFSKNFSLYGERVGALFVFSEAAENITSQGKYLIRRMYSNPPIHGMQIVKEVLTSPVLKAEWMKELEMMRNRIQQMRHLFVKKLKDQKVLKDFSFLEKMQGMFCFCALTPEIVQQLINEYGIYMMYDGRINVAGLNYDNIDQVTQAIAKVLS